MKASILLAAEGGLVAVMASMPDLLATAAKHSGWQIMIWVSALVLLLAAIIAAAAAILPVLGSSRRHRRESGDHLVYFGHLRLGPPSILAARIAQLTPDQEAQMLSRQLVVLSRLNWRKHRYVQTSAVLGVAALLALIVAAVPLWLR
jgi:hypothetical protein